MNKTTKYIIGGSVAAVSLILIVRAINKSGKQNQLPQNTPVVDSESSPFVRNYFGQKGMLSTVFPRGIRNNNPGNLKMGASVWNGELAESQNTDGTFEQFDTFEHGVRAMIKLVKNHINNGHNTIAKLIAKYAPSSENPTSTYVNAVAKGIGIDKNALLTPNKETLKKLVQSMGKFENGPSYPIYDSHFEDAYKML
jgi:hypothetical protein